MMSIKRHYPLLFVAFLIALLLIYKESTSVDVLNKPKEDPSQVTRNDINDIQTVRSTPETIDDITLVETYIKERVAKLVPERMEGSGEWSLVSLRVDPETNSGSFVYKNGRREGTAVFTYSRNGDLLALGIKKK